MKKKKIFLLLSFVSSLFINACNTTFNGPTREDMEAINSELKYCFNYFMDTTNFTSGSNGYGLTQDRYTNSSLSSIAATGFLLASYPVFVKENFITKEEGENYVINTLDTLLRIQADNTISYGGCMSHFLNKSNGKRNGNSEVSTIDTAICVSGAIAAGEFFEGEAKNKAETLWSNVDYNKFKITRNGKSYISMGVDDPNKEQPVQLGAWDFYAEQLMIYILGAGNPNQSHRINSNCYLNVTKNVGNYKTHSFIYSWFGSLFTYQFSQAFFNFRNYKDSKNRNYFENSKEASLAAYEYCVDNKNKYSTYSESSWGLTACDTPLGYNGFLGTPPRGYSGDANYNKVAGTVAPTAAIGSMPFTPEQSLKALKNYLSDPLLTHAKYGIKDAYNLDFNGSKWYCNDFIGIDKGIEILQLANYKYDDFVCNLSMNNDYVLDGFRNNGFIYTGDSNE